MGILEYIFERKNPGNVGGIQKNTQPIKHVSIPLLITRLFISSFIVYGLFYLTVMNQINLINIMTFIIILLVYCLISYKVIPTPDTSNVGLLGGLIDHPFRYTDDLNRGLMLLFILLYPGRFISTTIIQLLQRIKGK
jgi:hypothetical protein